MNRNYLRALSVAFGVVSASLSMGQGVGWVGACDDPTTTAPIYTTNYGGNGVGNDLFLAVIGLVGTATYECYEPDFVGENRGGINFGTGRVASVQTTEDDFVVMQDGGGFFWGLNPDGTQVFSSGGSRGNFSYFALVSTNADGTNQQLTKFGTVNIDTFFVGASDRYMIAESTMDQTRVELRVDAVGDAARLQWRLTNLTANPRGIGLWFGQSMDPIGNFSGVPKPINYIGIPGYRPLTIHRRFVANPNEAATDPREFPMPPYVDFAHTQAHYWEGQRNILQPTLSDGAFPDQTPVDGLDIGNSGFLLGAQPGNDGLFPDVIHEDITIGLPSFIQKWTPRVVQGTTQPVGERRTTIVSYYKTTWGDSAFNKPYSVVADSPKVIGVQDQNPFNFVRSPAPLRVYVDNIRGYTTAEQMIPIENAKVTLTLPQGMGDANDPSRRVITRTMGRIEPRQIQFVDFQVMAHPTTFGVLEYQVKIEPQPGPVRIVTGQITVASQPYLQVTQNANLVTAPWTFQSGSWAAILGSDPNPMQADVDFQAFTWDAATQQYLLQTGPQRGIGTWLISTQNVGFKQLGGNPQTPQDLDTGSPLIELYFGWNLIANPYNYPIQLGQIVGVPGNDKENSYTYQQLVTRNSISGSLAYWDRGTQSYKFIGDVADYLQPNHGYWINVTDPAGLVLSYPPVFTPFIPEGTGGISSSKSRDYLWQTNLTVGNGSRVDRVNTFGMAAPNVKDIRKTRLYEPPISPEKNSISSYFVAGSTARGQMKLARHLVSEGESRNLNFQVMSKKGGSVTVRWPEIASVPSTYDVNLRDNVTGRTIDMRLAESYTFTAVANQSRELRIIITVHNEPLLGAVTVARTGSGVNDPLAIKYPVSTPVQATVKIMQNGQLVREVAKSVDQSAGNQIVLWDLKNTSGNRVMAGTYQAVITVTDGNKSESKNLSFYLR